MKRIYQLSLIALTVGILGLHAESSRPKVGLVLSGGGARGFAHVGTLALIDSLNIPIDYIAGTSMGGIIGALYSIGYDAVEIDQLIRTMDWQEFFSDAPPRNLTPYLERKDDGRFQFESELEGWNLSPPSGLISGQKIRLYLSELTYAYENVQHFDDLPIPYRCVAVDLLSGNEVILESGSLSKALRSTMSIPTLFDPVEWGDSLLIDGGLLNNVPVDVVKAMGADIVITCNVGRPMRKREELNSLLEILEQSITIPEYNREDITLPLSDVIVSLKEISLNAADFSKTNIEAIIDAGVRAANDQIPIFEAFIKEHDLDTQLDEFAAKKTPSTLFGIHMSGNTTLPFDLLYELAGMTPGDTITADLVENRLRVMRRSDRIHDVAYSARFTSDDAVTLKLHIEESRFPRINGIKILGNHRLSYSFIYELLDIHKGDLFNPPQIAAHINQLYGLGVFKTIHYEIEPLDADNLILSIHVEEKPEDLIKLGWRYDNYHNLVGHIGFIHDNLFTPGLRLDMNAQFAGRQRANVRLMYPITLKGRVAYPYVNAGGLDESRTLFDFGQKIAIYEELHSTMSMGIGILFRSQAVLETELSSATASIEPEVGSTALQSWDNQHSTLNIHLGYDDLDDVIIPNTGRHFSLKYEKSLGMIGGETEYQRLELDGSVYQPTSSGGNLRLHTHIGLSTGTENLLYKWFYTMGPNDFVGVDLYELSWKRFMIFRMEYRHSLNREWFVKLIYNNAPNPIWEGDRLYPPKVKVLNGYGIGLFYDSVIGPVEFTLSLGDKLNADDTKSMRAISYFSAGYHF